MLRLLHIENIAVIERADVDFSQGLNVLTGETGAGKSIVIDAIEAVTGSRVRHDMVRTGSNGAVVTAQFDQEPLEETLRELDIELSEDDILTITRKISQDGKNTCRINGMPVPVAVLRQLGGSLVDIHGQNDGRKLLDESTHLGYLDAFGGLSSDVAEYNEIYKKMRAKKAELEALSMDESEKERRLDMLRYQVSELETADVKPGETDELTQRRELLRNAEKLTGAVDSAFCALYGGDETDGAEALLSEAEGELSGASRYSEELSDIAERLRGLRLEVKEAAEDVRAFRESLDFSPRELDDIEDRLSLLRRLSKKYGSTEEEMLEFLDSAKKELETIEFSGQLEGKLSAELANLAAKAKKAAKDLSDKRMVAGEKLSKRIVAELSELNMAGVRFCVHREDVTGEYGLNAKGCDEVSFLMSANEGENPGRISKIASGGELSRIMLAMKNVLSESDDVSAMVFDEIDTGVSGIAAQKVGEKLAALARSKQVLCVTHLPQIAAMADSHFAVEKKTEAGRTYTAVSQLDRAGRAGEIARLHGGDLITDTTLKSAEELLLAAESIKHR